MINLKEIQDIQLQQNSKKLQVAIDKQKIEDLEGEMECVHRSLRVRCNHIFLEQANRTLDLLIQDKEIKNYLAEMFEKKYMDKMRFKDTYWIMLCSHPTHEPEDLGEQENESGSRYCLRSALELTGKVGAFNGKRWK